MNSKEQDIYELLMSLTSASKNGVVNLSGELAKRIIEECSFDGQRDIKPHRLAKHRRNISSGQWCGDIHPITFADIPTLRKIVLVNGHHRCKVISEQEGSLPIQINFKVVASKKEARDLYGQFDDPDSGRTPAEVMDARLLPQDLDLGKDQSKHLYHAVSIIRSGFDVRSKTYKNDEMAIARDRNQVMDEMLDWRLEAKTFFEIEKLAQRSVIKKLRNAGVMAVALYTLRYQPEKAIEFWTSLAKNDGLRRGDPRSTLLDDFKTRVMNKGNKDQIVIAPALAWNAWMEKRDLKIIKVSPDAKLRITGTPIGGKSEPLARNTPTKIASVWSGLGAMN